MRGRRLSRRLRRYLWEDILFHYDPNDRSQSERDREYFKNLKITRKLLRDTSNIFYAPKEAFRRYYRISPQMAIDLTNLVRDELEHNKTTSISSELQVLITLRFMAEGALQKGVGQDFNHPVCQSLVSKLMNRVINAFCNLRKRFIRLPTTRRERIEIRTLFQKTTRIPGILGLVDGFLVRLRRPSREEWAYCNYREGSCVNVQIIVDAKGIIRGIRVIPGSNNDQFNWEFSKARRFLMSLRNNLDIVEDEGLYYFYGDLGYGLSPILLTPIEGTPEGSPEAMYTREHCGTRCLVEQTIGAMTGVWLCVNRSNKLCYTPRKLGKIITAAAVLHNFRKMNGLPDDEFASFLTHPDENIRENICENFGEYRAGQEERQFLINALYK